MTSNKDDQMAPFHQLGSEISVSSLIQFKTSEFADACMWSSPLLWIHRHFGLKNSSESIFHKSIMGIDSEAMN
jgi:hypothetical protein